MCFEKTVCDSSIHFTKTSCKGSSILCLLQSGISLIPSAGGESTVLYLYAVSATVSLEVLLKDPPAPPFASLIVWIVLFCHIKPPSIWFKETVYGIGTFDAPIWSIGKIIMRMRRFLLWCQKFAQRTKYPLAFLLRKNSSCLFLFIQDSLVICMENFTPQAWNICCFLS